MTAGSPAKRPDQYVGEQVRIARESRGWKQQDLVDRLTALGFTQWRQSKVTKIENGQVKRISLEDVLALAAALGVQPVHLLAPEGAQVEIAPKVVRSSEAFGLWMMGRSRLFPEDERSYFTGAIVPLSEIRAMRDALRFQAEIDRDSAALEARLKDADALEARLRDYEKTVAEREEK